MMRLLYVPKNEENGEEGVRGRDEWKLFSAFNILKGKAEPKRQGRFKSSAVESHGWGNTNYFFTYHEDGRCLGKASYRALGGRIMVNGLTARQDPRDLEIIGQALGLESK